MTIRVILKSVILIAAGLLILILRRQRNQARTAHAELAAASNRALLDAHTTIADLRDAVPVWFMAGAPLVEVVPMAEDFCLN
ncbi:MAG: hypothetical protein KDE23_17580 [Caldilinea sp.]|nr:hypothetical protein [Caldilinea sp.]